MHATNANRYWHGGDLSWWVGVVGGESIVEKGDIYNTSHNKKNDTLMYFFTNKLANIQVHNNDIKYG